MLRSWLVALTAAAVLSGCRTAGRITTAAGLADALKKEGVAWETMSDAGQGRLKQRGAIQEAFKLAGEGLSVELYRIEKKSFFKTAALGLLIRARTEPEGSEDAIADVCGRWPFLLVVIAEPKEHLVREALDRALPGNTGTTPQSPD